MPLIQIIIDDSTSKIITGTYEFDRTNGGTLLVPSGSSFPGTPAAKELFWRTDESKLYRRNDANAAWVAVVSAVATHATTHQPGGSDAMAVDAAAGTGSLRTLGTAATAACAGNDSRLSDARAPTAHKTTHEPGGSDALTVDAVAGTGSLRTLGTAATSACAGNDTRLSDARTPAAHSTSHKHGGSDEVATATPAANAIPKADASSKIDGWVTANAVAGTPSLRQLGTGATDACAGNDGRLSNARTPTAHAASHNAGGSDALAIDAVAGTGSLRTLGTAATAACAGNDSRLSNARTPTALASSHNAGGGDALAIDAAAGTGSLRTLGTAATAACAGNDSRLSDSRTPTAHATSHKNGGSDEVATATAAANAIPKAAAGGKLDIGWVPLGATSTTVCVGNDSRLSDARTPTAHASSHQPGGGDAMAVDAVAGTGSLRTLGTAATAACAGNDSRLSDARTPTAHATSHKSGGSDAIKLDELAAPTDITTLNATTGQHGLLPKLGGGTTNFLRADGTWAAPPGGASPVFGTEAQIGSSEGDSTTTGTTYISKLLLTTPSIPAGNYHVTWSIEAAASSSNRDIGIALYGDGVLAAEHSERLVVANYFVSVSGVANGAMGAGVHTVELFFRRAGGSSATITVRRARIEFWRIS